MRSSFAALCGVALFALSACGGGSTSAVPQTGLAPDGHTRAIDGSTVAYENGHLYVASDTKIREFAAQANGDGSKALRTIALPAGFTSTADIAVAPDGTIWLAGANGLSAFAPGQSTPELNVSLPSAACAVAVVGDGVDVMTAGTTGASPVAPAVYTYPYGGGAHPKPIRTLTLPAQSYCTMSTDNDDHIYAARSAGSAKDAIDEYAAAASGKAAPIHTLYAPAPIAKVTVAMNGTVYAVDGANTAQFVDVATATAAATGRRAAAECDPTQITSIAVDKSGDVYLGLSIPAYYLTVNYSDPRRVDVVGPASTAPSNQTCGSISTPPTGTRYSVTNAVGAGEVVRAVAIGP